MNNKLGRRGRSGIKDDFLVYFSSSYKSGRAHIKDVWLRTDKNRPPFSRLFSLPPSLCVHFPWGQWNPESQFLFGKQLITLKNSFLLATHIRVNSYGNSCRVCVQTYPECELMLRESRTEAKFCDESFNNTDKCIGENGWLSVSG